MYVSLLVPDLHSIALAIALTALIVGSYLLVLSGIPMRWHGIPLLGLIGFAISGVMGLRLVFSMMGKTWPL